VDRQARDRPVPGFKILVEGSVPIDFRIEEGFEPALDDERGCAKVLIALGFGSGAPNPLTLRTFRAHRRALADWPGR
jgi:hypothetical protein